MGTRISSLGRLRRPTPPGRPNNGTSHHMEESTHDRHLEPASVARYTGLKSRLFALIIGIDSYDNCKPLHGAVADAKEINRYLQETLGVSEGCIRILLNDRATRNAIISAFRDIRENEHIQKGDPILIFFAGHGIELYAPREWRIEGMIQGLLPHNYKHGRTHPIPDRTIGALIDDIAREKGNNITVIFDCCFAAGGTRIDDREYIPRSPEHIDPDILLDVNDLDQDIFAGRHGGIPEGLGAHGVESHVLLAACRTTERAYENLGHGLFTNELLKILRGSAVNRLTYAEVINRIELGRNDQHPSCSSVHKQRVLFNERVTDDGPVSYPIEVNRNNFVVSAGLAHGVSVGVEFTLYSERGRRLNTIKVNGSATIQDFETIVRIHPPRDARFAKLTRVGKISIYVAPERKPINLRENLRRMCQSNDANFELVEDPGRAKLGVAMESDSVCFEILDQRTKRFGLTRLPSVATLETVHQVLNAAAHYYWYLRLTHGTVDTHSKVDVNFYELECAYDGDGTKYRRPVGQGLCRKDPEDNSDVISFVACGKLVYGIEIRNKTPRDLYVNAFLFNSSSLKIDPYRIQSVDGNPEAPLKQNGVLTIGYGPGGGHPFKYWLSDGQNVDVGYLKLFFATRPIDLSGIIQGSPFRPDTDQREFRSCGDGREGGAVREEREFRDMLFTKVIPIVQKRRNARRV